MHNLKSNFLIGDQHEENQKKEKNFSADINNNISITKKKGDLNNANSLKIGKCDPTYNNAVNRQNIISYNSVGYIHNQDRRSCIPQSAYSIKKTVIKYNKIKKPLHNNNQKDRSHSVEYLNNKYSPNQILSNSIKPGSTGNYTYINKQKGENLFNNNYYQVYDKKQIGSRQMFHNNSAKSNNSNNNNKINNNILKDIYNPSARSVKEYSYKEDANKDCRDYMEDFCKIVDKFNNDDSKGLFCLYDGHGGIQPVNYVKERLPEVFSKFLRESVNTVEKALIYTFQKLDDELKLFSESQNVGTTACVVYFQTEKDIVIGSKRMLYCGNVGDTRALLITTKEVKRLTYDHKCSDQSEADRIRKIGGIIFNGRLFGQLALSRALGDHALKKYGVTPTPCINKHVINEKDKFVVICSDGVWDVLSDKDIHELASFSTNADELAKSIVNAAIDKGTQDNVSCIAIKIN